MKIVVLKGGVSSEREVSLNSGKIIADTLIENGHDVICLDTVLPFEQINTNIKVTKNHIKNGNSNLIDLLRHQEVLKTEFIFNALHGGSGEDGQVQGLLQLMNYKFNGSSSEGCAIAMDKVVSKLLFERYNIPTPNWQHFNRGNTNTISEMIDISCKNLTFPMVVKPSNEGSTMGLTIVDKKEELHKAIDFALSFNSEIIIEDFIAGRELTATIIDNIVYPLIEIIPKHEIYDYECKYSHGMSAYRVPEDLNSDVIDLINDLSLVGLKALKCSGYGRMDIRLSLDNIPYFLEFNTLPGMTDTSLVPKSANKAGISFNQLLEKIIETGLNNG